MNQNHRNWTWEQMECYFYISNENKPNLVFEWSLSDFLVEHNLQKLLHLYGEKIKAKNYDVTAMYLAGWFGYLCGGLHFFESDNKQFQPENVTVQLYLTTKGTPLLSFMLEESKLESKKDSSWLFPFYEEILTPLYQKLKHHSTNNLLHMWYQATHSLYWISHRMVHSKTPLSHKSYTLYEHALAQFKNDANAELFGVTSKKIPYMKRMVMVDNPWDLQDPMPLKPSCCLAYQTEGGHYCYTCPKMKKTERERKFQEVIKQHATTG